MYHCLYWYHRVIHTDIFLYGYVGVSKHHEKRDYEHRNLNGNPHLTNAFAKYDDIVCDVIMEDTEADCLDMENYFRPTKDIGWNIAPGGGKPPNWGQIWASMSEEQRAEHSAKMSAGWTDEQRAKHSATTSAYWASLSDEERAENGVRVSAWWAAMSEEQRIEQIAKALAGWTDEKRTEHGVKISAHYSSLTDEERDDRRNSHTTAKFLVVDKDCKVFHVDNMRQFCRENGLSSSNMVAVAVGRRNQHKGFRVISWPKNETFSMSLDRLVAAAVVD